MLSDTGSLGGYLELTTQTENSHQEPMAIMIFVKLKGRPHTIPLKGNPQKRSKSEQLGGRSDLN